MVESRNIKHIVCVERIKQLEKENKTLEEKIKKLEFDVDAWHQLKLLLEGEIEKLKEYNGELIENHKKDIDVLCEENKKLREKLSEITMVADDEKQSIEHILELEEEIRSLELENRSMKVESEDLKMWLREKLPLALLKEYMEKFEGVDLKNV